MRVFDRWVQEEFDVFLDFVHVTATVGDNWATWGMMWGGLQLTVSL